ncbi:MAG: DUF5906 domain-containing protein [Martelella sp.]|uniref:DUF5906 domain-containing protein n=1 Tax=Martelella sp. TaxID=1969699 RepID=UPI0032430050
MSKLNNMKNLFEDIENKTAKVIPFKKSKFDLFISGPIADWLNEIAGQHSDAYVNSVGLLKAEVVAPGEGGYDRKIAKIEIDGSSKKVKRVTGAECEQREAIDEWLASQTFPVHVNWLDEVIDPPARWQKECEGDCHHVYRTKSGKIHTLKLRYLKEDGGKAFLCWSMWEMPNGEAEWLPGEGPNLPLYGSHKLSLASSTVIIVEGEKTAEAVWRIQEGKIDHPWKHFFEYATVLAFAGENRVDDHDWNIGNPDRVIIVPDASVGGRAVVPGIARKVRCETQAVYIPDDFPVGWDFADPMPDKYLDSTGRWFGVDILSLRKPATWLTDLRALGASKKLTPVLRKEAISEWLFLPDSGQYVHRHLPFRYDEKTFNKKKRPFCDTAEVSKLIDVVQTEALDGETYDPSQGRIVTNSYGRFLNAYRPSSIRPLEGDATPFIEFIDYLIPNEKERREVLRWIRTLVCRPDIRMLYSVFLSSKAQGTGKGTLFERIVIPLVGEENCSTPDTDQLKVRFAAGWIANKRLAYVAEMYANQKWALFNGLKKIITDRTVTIEKKYEEQKSLPNWITMAGSANGKGHIAIDDDDRRWLVADGPTEHWPQEKFDTLFKWLQEENGLAVIRHWLDNALEFPYVSPSERAPDTDARQACIGLNVSTEEQELVALFDKVKNGPAVALGARSIVLWLKAQIDTCSPHWQKPQNICRLAEREGLTVTQDRYSKGGYNQQLIVKKAGLSETEIKSLFKAVGEYLGEF